MPEHPVEATVADVNVHSTVSLCKRHLGLLCDAMHTLTTKEHQYFTDVDRAWGLGDGSRPAAGTPPPLCTHSSGQPLPRPESACKRQGTTAGADISKLT